MGEAIVANLHASRRRPASYQPRDDLRVPRLGEHAVQFRREVVVVLLVLDELPAVLDVARVLRGRVDT